jgi:hypothetical protein
MTARRLGIPERDHVRLRVRVAAAPARLPRATRGRRAGGDPARSGSSATAPAAEARAVPRPEGGVLPRRLRALTARRSSRSSSTRRGRSWSCGTPPDVSLYHRRSNPLFPQVLEHLGPERGGERDRDPAHRGTALVRARARPAVDPVPSGRSTRRA